MKKLNTLTDEELVDMYIAGNDTAFDVIMKRYESKVFSYIYYSVKSQEQAEDLYQEVFMKVIVRLRGGQYKEDGKFGSWIIRLAHNLLVDQYRKTPEEIIISNDECEVDLFNDPCTAVNENREQEMIDEQLWNDVQDLINQLPPSQREVLMLRYFDDLSFKEIAEKTECSINTALGRMRYALMNIKKLARGIA